MITLNDYLYSGNTVLKILHNYSHDLRLNAVNENNPVDLLHASFLEQYIELLEHNDFLTSQSNRIIEFYKYMAKEYPFLAFTFKGRIKSLIRVEEKFNGYVSNYIYDYYCKNHTYPSIDEISKELTHFKDLIAYRIVISMPQCHVQEGQDKKEIEKKYLYEIANVIPSFLKEREFTPEESNLKQLNSSVLMNEEVRPYFRDYVENKRSTGYESLHITFFDRLSQSFMELQIRTKDMDDFAEIGGANHQSYEDRQNEQRSRRETIKEGECKFFDEAYERGQLLQKLDLSKVDVCLFSAVDNVLMNDSCGLYRGRLILPYEHLSRFQNDQID